MIAAILAIGDELVFGDTVDTNTAWLADRLRTLGIETLEHLTVRDNRAAIAEAIARAADRADVVLVTGGLGPTPDDVTREALADAMGAELQLDNVSLAEIEAFFKKRNYPMSKLNRSQAMVPAGAAAITNLCGTAPGLAATISDARVFVTPGVPMEMKDMFDRRIAPEISDPRHAITARVIHTFGQGESTVAQTLLDLMHRDGLVTVGTTVSGGMVSVRITSRGQPAQAQAEEIACEVCKRLGPIVVGQGDETMASVILAKLRAVGRTLSAAESCTGGLVAKLVTDIPGASDCFAGGVVSYSNALKQSLLGVPEALLREHGAVSEPVAAAMADGCRQRLGTDYAVSLTGIAGPTGGTDEKPVGLVFIGLATPESTEVHQRILPGNRDQFRLRASLAALDYIRLALP